MLQSFVQNLKRKSVCERPATALIVANTFAEQEITVAEQVAQKLARASQT